MPSTFQLNYLAQALSTFPKVKGFMPLEATTS
jgi:hypothetical protein